MFFAFILYKLEDKKIEKRGVNGEIDKVWAQFNKLLDEIDQFNDYLAKQNIITPVKKKLFLFFYFILR